MKFNHRLRALALVALAALIAIGAAFAATNRAAVKPSNQTVPAINGDASVGSTLTAVNFPEVSLTEHPGMHRLIHIHQNVPGMLLAVNSALARENTRGP